MTSNYKRGFTLIELLVVIAIIGIVSSVVLASLNSARQKGRDARRISDVKQVQLALELFYDANQSYPSSTNATALGLLRTNGYIAAVPADPGSYTYEYQPKTAASADCSATTCASYILRAQLETAGHSALNGDIDGEFTDALAAGCDDGTSYYYCQRP